MATPQATSTIEATKVPPHDLLAEQSTLGGMLISSDAVADVLEEVRGQDFYSPKHEVIFEAILTLYSHGEPTDTVAVCDQLLKTGDLQRAGGADYIHHLTSIVPTAANAGFYASIVADKATLRRLVTAGTRIAQAAYASEGEVTELVNNAQAEIYAVNGTTTNDAPSNLNDALQSAIENIEAASRNDTGPTGIPTGFHELDEITGGLHSGQMIVIAARPAMGKSTLALDIARSAAIDHNKATVFFSLEMGQAELATRTLSTEASLPLHKLRKGMLVQRDWQDLAHHRSRIIGAPLFIDDSPNLTLAEIRAKSRKLKAQYDLKLIIIDYLQLLSSGKRVESRQQEVSEFSRALKLLAKELEVPVIALSQLNRGPEGRPDKKPAISDLRESGSIEQDADLILLLHRENYYNDDIRPGEADIHLAKHRNGPTSTIPVAFQGHYSRFTNMTQQQSWT